ncbi:MAG: ribonuclease E/G [Sphingomonadales bacterium]
MAETVCIDSAFGEIRTAVVDGGTLIELHYYRIDDRVQDGDVFLARVTRTAPGVDGVFLDLGGGIDGFLPRRGKAPDPGEGSLIPIQVREGPRAGKAARVSRLANAPDPSGTRPGLIHRNPLGWLDPVRHREPDAILIADTDLFNAARAWAARENTPLAGLIGLDRDDALFERMGIEAGIADLFAPRLTLPSGGAITIEHATASVVIDVDTATASGGDSEAVAARVNREAAREIARQLRLRRVGGLVFVDFVSMRRHRSRRDVLATLDAALASDPVRTERSGLSSFGVVELMRERRGTPLMDRIAARTPGPEPSPETRGYAALRALIAQARRAPGEGLVIDCDADTARWLGPRIDDAGAQLHALVTLGKTLNSPGWSVYSRPRK